MTTYPPRKTLTAALSSAAAAPSLSADPAWRAAQGRALVVLVVGFAVALWLGRRGRWVLAGLTVTAFVVVLLRQLRVMEHMARVTPPTSPVDDASILAPSASDLLGASSRPVLSLGAGGALLTAAGAAVTPEQVAATTPEVSLRGDSTDPAYWLAVEQLNAAGVHVLDGGR